MLDIKRFGIGLGAILLLLTPVLAKPAEAAVTSPVYWGAAISGSLYGLPEPPADMRAVDVFEQHAGKKVSIINFGQSWYTAGKPLSFPQQQFDNIRNHGSIPLFTWSSKDNTLPRTDQPAFKNTEITNGTYDAYITQFATAVRDWGHPMFMRFDAEMNGWWWPWAQGTLGSTGQPVNGNAVGDYIPMWRHVHDIFDQVGASNVTWVWCINHEAQGTNTYPPLDQIYPGDNYVDWISYDAYNRYSPWISFDAMTTGTGTNWLYNTYQLMKNVAPTKPIMLAEFGSKEDLNDPNHKAAWFTDALLTQVPNNFPDIKAIVYFNYNYSTDPTQPDATIAIESSAASQAAFASGIASSFYATNTFGSLDNGKILPLASDITPPPEPQQSTNLLQNPSFENSGSTWVSPWVFSIKSPATGGLSQELASAVDGTKSAKINVTKTGSDWFNVSLAQGKLGFSSSKNYSISFWAKASSARTSRAIIQQNYNPWKEYTKQIVNIGTTWQKYTLSFTSPVTDANLKLAFSAADAIGSLWLDNVSVIQTN